MDNSHEKKRRPPPAVFSDDPEASLERELQENPDDEDTKVDVGSDESMDASDPVSAARPEHREPVPSSGYEDEDAEDSESHS